MTINLKLLFRSVLQSNERLFAPIARVYTEFVSPLVAVVVDVVVVVEALHEHRDSASSSVAQSDYARLLAGSQS